MPRPFLFIVTLVFITFGCAGNEAIEETQSPIFSDEPITVFVKGMHCEACVKSAENALSKLDGVAGVEISFDDETAVITPRNDSYPDFRQISEALKSIGYTAEFLEL